VERRHLGGDGDPGIDPDRLDPVRAVGLDPEDADLDDPVRLGVGPGRLQVEHRQRSGEPDVGEHGASSRPGRGDLARRPG
jgi:hypothetical protein